MTLLLHLGFLRHFKLVLPVFFLGGLLAACDGDGDALPEDDTALNADYGKPLLEVPPSTEGKSDGFDVNGPPVAGLQATTEVWPVTRRWYEIDQAAGLAWPANSGLTWDEKYALWVDSLEKTSSGYNDTFILTTPWGKSLPSPRLECAETSMFLRVTFASWYGLPFYMSALSSTGTWYFGHFGVVDKNGQRIPNFPTYKSSYKDYTSNFQGLSQEAMAEKEWPTDQTLRGRYLTTMKDDDNSAILGDKAYSGAYFDEIFLNKRTGHFMIHLLAYTGSVHLASTDNTFNLKPEAIRAGDTLLERWQRQGIGHTVVIKSVDHLPGGKIDVETIFGSMPRIQAVWYNHNRSKYYLTSNTAGGVGTSSDGFSYASLGGGLKRWRTGVVKSGRWVNIVPVKDRDFFINSSDHAAISKRPEQFATMMGELTPEEQRIVVLDRIDEARKKLRRAPSSCVNRSTREEGFQELYALSEDHFGMDAYEVDQAYRIDEDYVFAELEYNKSRTCCWNGTNAAMYEIIMAYHDAREAENQSCSSPEVFKWNEGYDKFKNFAISIGRGGEWNDWSEDEPCQGRDVRVDQEVAHDWTDYCALEDIF